MYISNRLFYEDIYKRKNYQDYPNKIVRHFNRLQNMINLSSHRFYILFEELMQLFCNYSNRKLLPTKIHLKNQFKY